MEEIPRIIYPFNYGEDIFILCCVYEGTSNGSKATYYHPSIKKSYVLNYLALQVLRL